MAFILYIHKYTAYQGRNTIELVPVQNYSIVEFNQPMIFYRIYTAHVVVHVVHSTV